MASNALKQLIGDADWGELDYFVLDTPPGTSDIHLTLLQTLAITGAVIVSTPQKVALADARKGIDMYRNDKVNVPTSDLLRTWRGLLLPNFLKQVLHIRQGRMQESCQGDGRAFAGSDSCCAEHL